jgi:riboflavin kinase/FMN adenylyltransferase
MGFEVELYSEMRVRKDPVSSTHIRTLLDEGEVGRATHLLGRPFSIQSTPKHGRGYGSRYTVPTINLEDYGELVPKDGVYITRTRVGEECFDSVTNVGNRPTFGAHSFAIESHLMNFHPIEMTEETRVTVHFLKRLRDEIKFPSVEDLRQQIGRDIGKAQRYFGLVNLKSGASAR